MRPLRRPQPSRLRVLAFVALGVLGLLLLSANGIAALYTDFLWFDSLGFGSVWSTVLGTQIVLGLIFTVLFFVIMWVNLFAVDRLKPAVRIQSAEEELVERYQAFVGERSGLVRIGVAGLFALLAGGNTSAQWSSWLLFRNGGDFGGEGDALFGRDAGFYVFELPFITFVIDWLFATLILVLIAVALFHYLNGGIRASGSTDRVSSGAKVHISVLLAVLALIRAVAYWFDRFELVTSTRGAYDGALATDVNVQLPALQLLTLVSLFCAGLFLANVRRDGWGLPAVAVGIWALTHFVMAGIFPLAYQRIRIDPVVSTQEARFVERNIAATRFAYGLDDSRLTEVALNVDDDGLTTDDVDDYGDVLNNVPVVDLELAVEDVERSEAERRIYTFGEELDIDRYTIDGQTRPVAISVRGLDVEAVGTVETVGTAWERQHISFTHGYGVAMPAAYDSGRVEGESRSLEYLVRGLGSDLSINEEIGIDLEQPRVYYGEDLDGYAIVGANRDEVDFQTRDNAQQSYRYTGDGGVEMASLVRRIAYSLRFREPDPLISGNITDESRVIYTRDIEERVRTLAPFLRLDSNPYPVLVDGGIFWIVDGYTTTSDYPYAQSVNNLTNITGELSSGYNYIRNSVKAVVDAYNGDVRFFVVDESDPLINAWRQTFPELFIGSEDVPPQLAEHFRYPEGIFTVQTDMWERYVVDNGSEFIEGGLWWSVAAQPPSEAQESENDTALAAQPMDPQYLMARVPLEGADDAEFILQRAFVPRGGRGDTSTARPELTGVMMARSDPESYGELVMVRVSEGEVFAPNRVHAEIRKDSELTNFVLRRAGARVAFGEMSLVLVDDTILYVRPVYVQASTTAVPELQRVIAFNDNRIFMGQSVQEAIAGVVGGARSIPSPTPTPGDEPATPVEDLSGLSIVDLLALADGYLDDADLAEENGLPEEAMELRIRAQNALRAAQDLLGGNSVRTPDPVDPAPVPAEEDVLNQSGSSEDVEEALSSPAEASE